MWHSQFKSCEGGEKEKKGGGGESESERHAKRVPSGRAPRVDGCETRTTAPRHQTQRKGWWKMPRAAMLRNKSEDHEAGRKRKEESNDEEKRQREGRRWRESIKRGINEEGEWQQRVGGTNAYFVWLHRRLEHASGIAECILCCEGYTRECQRARNSLACTYNHSF